MCVCVQWSGADQERKKRNGFLFAIISWTNDIFHFILVNLVLGNKLVVGTEVVAVACCACANWAHGWLVILFLVGWVVFNYRLNAQFFYFILFRRRNQIEFVLFFYKWKLNEKAQLQFLFKINNEPSDLRVHKIIINLNLFDLKYTRKVTSFDLAV